MGVLLSHVNFTAFLRENQTCTELRATIFRVTFAPEFPGEGQQWTHTGEVPEKGQFCLGKSGEKATQDGKFGACLILPEV